METDAKRQRISIHTLICSLLATSLAACSVTEALVLPPEEICGPKATARLEAADPAQARIIDISISEGEFTPMIINLRQERPYTFRIQNTDNENRLFSAPEFFLTAAIGNIEIDERKTKSTCLDRLYIPAGKTSTITLMPLRAGAYEFEDSFVIPSGGIGIGAIRVEPSYSAGPEEITQNPS